MSIVDLIEFRKLERALKKYGRHTGSCATRFIDSDIDPTCNTFGKCDCGYAHAIRNCEGADPDDKIDREILKRMLNCLIGKNVKLKQIIDDIEDWGVVSFDEPLLKLITALKSGEGRK